MGQLIFAFSRLSEQVARPPRSGIRLDPGEQSLPAAGHDPRPPSHRARDLVARPQGVMWVRRTLLSFIAILLALVVVLVAMQQWRSWRLDHSLAQASKTVAAVREAASAVEYKPRGSGCSPKDPKLYAAWRDSILDAYDALRALRSVHGPGSPHLQALIRQLATISEDVSLVKANETTGSRFQVPGFEFVWGFEF